MKLGIIIDSASGLTKKQAESRGWIFLPLYLTVDGKEYADGIDITAKEYYDMINVDMDVKTSSTPPAMIMDAFEKASKEYDEVIVYPLSKGLSSQVNTMTTFSKDFKNVHIIQSQGVGTAIASNLEILEGMAKADSSIDEILKKGEELTKDLFGVVAINTMDWLVKGGRASSGAAAMANMLKIVPLIAFKDGALEKFGKGRVFKKAVVKAALAVKEQVGPGHDFIIYNGGNKDIDKIAASINEAMGETLPVTDFPPIIGNHTGPGVVAIIAVKKN